MSWFTQTLSSTLGRKLIMALTGLFLIIFLVVHLIGNLQLLYDDGGQAFNIYAKFMTTNSLVKVASYGLYAGILIHVIWSLLLTLQNRKARGGVRYAVEAPAKSVGWNSRNMGILGTIVFVFLVIHMRGFWYEMHWGGIPTATYEGEEYKDLYAVVKAAFSNGIYVAVYCLSMLAVAFHLFHGFQSAFQTIGLDNKKYLPAIKGLGVIYSVVIPGLFALIPLWMYFKG